MQCLISEGRLLEGKMVRTFGSCRCQGGWVGGWGGTPGKYGTVGQDDGCSKACI